MKRFFTSFFSLLLGIAAVQAQVRITCDGKDIQDGDTLTFYAYEIADEFGMYDTPEAGPAHAPLFTNTSGADIEQFAVSVKTSENCADAGIYWCGLTTTCADVKGGTETREITLPAQATKTMDMHGRFTLKDYQTFTVDVVVSIGGARYLSFCEVFVYDKEHATGIAPVSAQHSVHFAHGALHYDFPTAEPRRIAIYSAKGHCVESVAATTKSGVVNLGTLSKGTYIYIIKGAGRNMARGKFLVR